ncbi:MAG TPA: S41 family peptidase, partial [Acidobacteriota bacterium]|nr:S41 family peptidase [Acidobacteriota bacterium]
PVVLILIIISLSLAGGLLGGNALSRNIAVSSTPPSEFLSSFTEALDVIQQNYVDEVDSDELVYSAIKGMLRVLDPHSSFLDPKEFARIREDQLSRYYGLGIRVRPLFQGQGRHVIVEPPSIGTPAQRKGLRAGDVIIRIEGKPIDDWTSDDVVSHLKGPKGTIVNITIERPGVPEPIYIDIERDEIPLITVPYVFELKPGIGYIKIDRFSESTATEFRDKFKQIEGVSGLILDLRDNPGGLLTQAIEISDFFLPRGELIVSTKGRTEGSARAYTAPNEEKIRIPIVILINRHSASASEIVAGALQDHDRALIVGERSFGKGLVQSVYTLENETGLLLTTAKYYTPSGRLIQRDYSGSNFEYYFIEKEGDKTDNEVRHTDNLREVFSGGGITPDIIESARELNRFELQLASRDAFFQFARRLTSGEVPSAGAFQLLEPEGEASDRTGKAKVPDDLEISDAILDEFRKYLRNDLKVEFSDVDFLNNVEFIKRRILQEAYNSSFGIQEGFKIGIQGDNQVLKALELMPEAKSLMLTGQISPRQQNEPIQDYR